MHILVLKGSPNKDGSTSMLVSEFVRGAREAGHAVYAMDITNMDIEPCGGCVVCGYEGYCVKTDQMHEVSSAVLASDMVVFATPLYYYGMTAQLKTVVDRMIAYNKSLRAKGMKSALISVGWNDDDWNFDALNVHYDSLVRYLNFEDKGRVLALACGTPDLTKESSYPEQAYQLGKNL